MTKPRSVALQYAKENRLRFISELTELLRIPSISSDPNNKTEMQRAADWIAEHLKSIGIDNVKVFQTSLHPIVYGEYQKAGTTAPTVLVYGHYDVQPPEPLDKWNTKPFEPILQGDNLFARGASDMKGQTMAAVKAIESILEQGVPPANIKFIIEGEEEIGSPSAGDFLLEKKDLLASDVVLNLDAGMVDAQTPGITYGLRGIAYFELRVFGPASDLHSGRYGGVFHNPAQALCEIISGMHDESGRITLPGYYDRVRLLEDNERQSFARINPKEISHLDEIGAPALWGEPEYSPIERIGARPTLEINGLFSGFTGEGAKTVIPSYAMAKISCRLVPDQDPEEVHQQLLAYLNQFAPKTIKWELDCMMGNPACITDRNQPTLKAMEEALETVWGTKPVYKRDGGSIPIVSQMQEILGLESILSGFGLPDDNIHAPNEKLHLPTWQRGIEAVIHFFYNLQ